MLGIVFGVAAVISMLSIAEGTAGSHESRSAHLGATNIIIRSVKPSEETPGLWRQPARDDPQLRAQVQRLRPDRRDDSRPSARCCRSGKSRSKSAAESYTIEGRVVGTTEDYADFNLLQMEKGRFLTASDNEKYENFAVLAAETAEKLFPYEDPLGQAIKLGSDYYTVVGVTRKTRKLAPGSAAAWPHRTITETFTSRSTPASSDSASESSTIALARGKPRRPSLPRSRSRSDRWTTCCRPCP